MKIFALVTDAYESYGGIANYNVELLSALAQLEPVSRIHVLPRVGAFYKQNSVPRKIYRHRPVKNRVFYSMHAFWICLRYRPTILFNGHLLHSPLAHVLSKLFRINVISQLHGTEIWSPIGSWAKRALVNSSLVLCVSRDTKDQYLQQVGYKHDNATVLPNTYRPIFFEGDRAAARRNFNLNEEFTLLTVARLDGRGGYKGHDRVIRLLPRLKATRPIRYLIAGSGPDRDRLEKLTKKLGVSHIVSFLGRVPDEQIADLYRAADLFVLPSRGEGFGIVFLEAMACGTPAIGLNVGGAADAFKDGELGICADDEKFEDVLFDEVSKGRGSSEGLSSAVKRYFGREAFAKRVRQAFEAKVGLKRFVSEKREA